MEGNVCIVEINGISKERMGVMEKDMKEGTEEEMGKNVEKDMKMKRVNI